MTNEELLLEKNSEVIEELEINEETKIEEILKFFDITLEEFYYNFICEKVNRSRFWRGIVDKRIVISRK